MCSSDLIIVRPRESPVNSQYDAEDDFSVPWATRGLALVRLENEQNIYYRVGYFELSREHPGMEVFPGFPKKGRNRRHRPYPVVDRTGFFHDCPVVEIEIV